jgi:hypothetical protein
MEPCWFSTLSECSVQVKVMPADSTVWADREFPIEQSSPEATRPVTDGELPFVAKLDSHGQHAVVWPGMGD